MKSRQMYLQMSSGIVLLVQLVAQQLVPTPRKVLKEEEKEATLRVLPASLFASN